MKVGASNRLHPDMLRLTMAASRDITHSYGATGMSKFANAPIGVLWELIILATFIPAVPVSSVIMRACTAES